MTEQDKHIEILLYDLRERAKELNCLYQVQELLSHQEMSIDDICEEIVDVVPHGWQYPDVCQAEISLGQKIYQSREFIPTEWVLSSDIIIQDETIGSIRVSYTEDRPIEDEGPFLKEERKLINTIAEQFGLHLLHQRLREVFQERLIGKEEKKSEWWIILDLLERTDPKLLVRISRKMINHLYRKGVKEADELLKHLNPENLEEQQQFVDGNQPTQFSGITPSSTLSDDVFSVASRVLTESEILENIQKWIKEDRSGFLVNILVNPGSSLEDISTAIERYHHLVSQGLELSESRESWFRIALIRRILSDQTDYIDVAKEIITVDDFSDFLQRAIFPAGSHGKLGGKSSGLFIARQILRMRSTDEAILKDVRVPKTWYLTSDGIFYFMGYNNLEDIIEQKYKDVEEIRQEYPYIVNIFKNSPLPPEIIKGLSIALDDFGDVPLIVRSSSLLEDRTGTAFAGKYKSLFIANSGSKEERLHSLMDAIAEVYASMFGPDPIKYRYEHNLINHHEEMGIMIQEVVGQKVGHYFFPLFAGVAFSNNEFRWSSRIKRKDGLIRMVPGLGTRAVDRLSDDYPVMISPGQPNLRVNITHDEIVRYSPKFLDVINLESGHFDTITVNELIREYGSEIPYLNKLVSVSRDGRMQNIGNTNQFTNTEEYVITFDGLISRTSFVEQVRKILEVLEKTINLPVDIEFAHDGENFFILQCRAQSYMEGTLPLSMPDEIQTDDIIFSGHRFITSGYVTGITDIVYVDPDAYSSLESWSDLHNVGRIISQLNQELPKRKFILMGPGRWGSRGDIKLGVSVTYSDINNTAMLIEVTRHQGGIGPDPSFGTHFFQDLVEASIYYLPLFPDDPATAFNFSFFKDSPNHLSQYLPDADSMSDVIKVIGISKNTPGKILTIMMDGDSNYAAAYLSDQESN